MIDKLKSLLGAKTEEEIPETITTKDINRHADGDYHISTETIRKGDSDHYTARVDMEIAGAEFEQGDTVSGVLRDYDGSLTIEENIRNFVADNGSIPLDEWTDNPSPDHNLLKIALVPGECIAETTTGQYLAVPIWGDE